MDNEKLLAFYEKLYYHEFDNREKLTARLQFSLGMLTIDRVRQSAMRARPMTGSMAIERRALACFRRARPRRNAGL